MKLQGPNHNSRRPGFSLVELLAVLVIIGCALVMIFPARASSKTKAQSIQCLDNLKQVAAALDMYTRDYHDLLPPNPDDGTTQRGYTWCTGPAGIGQSAEFNPDLLADPVQCLIAPYIGTNVSVFRCTADGRIGTYDGAGLYPNSPLKGKKVPAARTISLSQAVGTTDPCFSSGGSHCGVPTLPVNGAWLTGSHGGNKATTGPYRTYGKTSQMVVPSPAQLLTFIEEAPYSINDGGLAASANLSNPIWVDFPSALHNNGCVSSFADSHVEFRKWVLQGLNATVLPLPVAGPNNSDWLWLAQHVSARY